MTTNTKKGYRIAKEVKEQILKRVREEGVSVSQASLDHGVSEATIYKWLTKGVSGSASDFTYIKFKKRTVHLATIIDLFTKEAIGFSVPLCHFSSLIMNALTSAVSKHLASAILHSDQGSEYTSLYSIGKQSWNYAVNEPQGLRGKTDTRNHSIHSIENAPGGVRTEALRKVEITCRLSVRRNLKWTNIFPKLALYSARRIV